MSDPRTISFRRATIVGMLFACVAAIFAAPVAEAQTPRRGDPDWVNPDVIALRDEVELLRREVARLQAGRAVNGDIPSGGSVGGAAPTGDYYVRLEQLETETRRLIGEMERIAFETRRAMRARDAQTEELYARIATLEGALGVTPPPSNAPKPGEGPDITGPTSGGIAPTPTSGGAAASGAATGAAAASSAGARAPGTLGEISGSGSAAAVTDAPIFENGAEAAGVAPVTDVEAGVPALSGPASYEDALEFLRARDLEKAEAAFTAFIAANPSDPRIGEATYWLGETYYVRGQYDKAARSFLTSFREHPTSAKAPDSLLRLGVTLAQLRQKDEACASFEQVAVRYPDAPQTLLRRADVEAKRAGCQ